MSETMRRGAKSWSSALGLAALFLFLQAPPCRGDVAIAGKAGTLGLGVELTAGVARQLNARVGINAINYSEQRIASDIEYEAEAELRTATALLDWHPREGGFRLTAGLVYNDSRVNGSSLPPASGFYDIGGVRVPAALVGTLDGTIEFDPVVPYAGLGWGNAVSPGRRTRFFFDLGVIFQGQGDVKLTPVIPAGSPLNDPIARALLEIQLEREAQEIEEDATEYDLYPVAAFGLSYRF